MLGLVPKDRPFRALFMDDDAARHRRIQEIATQFPNVELVRVWTVDEFEATIRASLTPSARYDAVLLDHDLMAEDGWTWKQDGHGKWRSRQYVMQSRQGMEAVEVLEQLVRARAKHLPRFAVVHSWNSTKAPIMTRRLNAAGFQAVYVPFPHYPSHAYWGRDDD